MVQALAWRAAVPVVALAAGLLGATSASSAADNPRAGRRAELAGLVEQRQQQVDELSAQRRTLQREVDDATARAVTGPGRLAELSKSVESLSGPAGLTAVQGRGVTVSLDDAPRLPDGSRPAGARPDDLVVHQQDVQSVVNALWRSGATEMMIMDQRVIATTAVRCVGNTLLLHDAVYGPPFVITALGDQGRMVTGLDQDVDVALFRAASDAYGLGYTVERRDSLKLPSYDGRLILQYASLP